MSWVRTLMQANGQKEVDRTIIEAGEQAVYEAGVPGMHPEIIKVLGRLKYRTSYGQNQLAHAVETAKLAAVIAAELGADVEVARAGALLHDLGKAIDYNMEGTHAQLGAEIAKRYGMPAKVVNAIASHHHEVEQDTVEAAIVEAADAISGARPGARRESLEQYIKRVRALEEIANSHKGVHRATPCKKGGAVFSHVLIAPRPEDLYATRIAMNESDLVLGCDLITSASNEALSKVHAGRTKAVLNTAESPTADFVRNPNWQSGAAGMLQQFRAAVGTEANAAAVDATGLATQLLGDGIYANPFVLGFAWQKGWIPLAGETLLRAIELNGVAIDANRPPSSGAAPRRTIPKR